LTSLQTDHLDLWQLHNVRTQEDLDQIFREGGVTSMKDAMHYVLSEPVSTVIAGCGTVAQLEENVKMATELELHVRRRYGPRRRGLQELLS
jgi:aryl-alcohol dehydrogenase-like predicted oxidoreductase